MSISKDQIREIMRKAELNAQAVENCAGPHEFIDITPEFVIGKKFQCSKCGGIADHVNVSWYRRGIEHGRL